MTPGDKLDREGKETQAGVLMVRGAPQGETGVKEHFRVWDGVKEVDGCVMGANVRGTLGTIVQLTHGRTKDKVLGTNVRDALL